MKRVSRILCTVLAALCCVLLAGALGLAQEHPFGTTPAQLGQLAEKVRPGGGPSTPTAATNTETPMLPPDIQFEERAYDFGVIGQKEKVTHIYRFKNAGEGELRISEVKTSCGCTAALLTAKEVPPGGSGEVKVTFNSGNFRGRKTKTVSVYSNDPDEPVARLKITGIVKNDYIIEPARLHLGSVSKGKPVSRKVTIYQTEGEGLKVERVEAGSEHLSLDVTELQNPERRGYEILVTLGAEVEVGRFQDVLTIYTNLEKHPKIHVPVLASIEGDVRAVPARLFLGTLEAGDSPTRKISVSSRSESSFEIIKVESSSSFISTEVSKIEEGRGYEILVTLAPEAPEGLLKAQITIVTTSTDVPEITVPVYGAVQSRKG